MENFIFRAVIPFLELIDGLKMPDRKVSANKKMPHDSFPVTLGQY